MGCSKDGSAPTGANNQYKVVTLTPDTLKPSVLLSGTYAKQPGNTVTVVGRGACWSLKPAPTVLDSNAVIGGDTTGAYQVSVLNVPGGKKIYTRAFLKLLSGSVFYGNEITFTRPLVQASGIANPAFNITNNSANIQCFVTDRGGGIISKAGVLYSTTPNPVYGIASSAIPDPTYSYGGLFAYTEPFVVVPGENFGTQTFYTLATKTTYYYRIFIVNGTSVPYVGPVQTFKTL